MNVSLTNELDRYVQDKVQSGMYHSASEVIREGLRLLKERDALQEVRLEELRAQVQQGFEQIERGEFRDFATGDELTAHIVREGRRQAAAKAGK